ncbi:MAG: glycosyltransferase family 4 protein [Chitinophagaceae bacterium]|nr:glycosyltransferase family 4 protein [Chitinophagaceae bacterium]
MKRKKILVLCPHPVGYAPGQRLKYEQYFDHWKANGYDLTVSSFMSERMQKIVYKKGYFLEKIAWTIAGYGRRILDLFRIRQYDVVYSFLWVTPFGPPVFEWMVAKLARKLIFDIDDLVYMKNERADKWYTSLFKGREKPIYLMKKADHVITCTPYLDTFVRKFNSKTTDISSTINTVTYIPVNKFTNAGPITLGWSGSHSTIRYLSLLHPILKELRKEFDFKLLVMGDAGFTLEGINVEAHAWTEEKEIEILQRMDIGLYPLPLDEEWVYGKSGLKALQYMALGLPVIATAIGANFRVVSEGETGFLVTTPEQWLEKLRILINDPELRKRFGQKARERVQQHYSVIANQPVYLDILNKVTNE